jgi:hypothetical protein
MDPEADVVVDVDGEPRPQVADTLSSSLSPPPERQPMESLAGRKVVLDPVGSVAPEVAESV